MSHGVPRHGRAPQNATGPAAFRGTSAKEIPILWPALAAHPDDYSAENRLIGALGLQDQRFEYAFTDVFDPGRTRFGPGADAAMRERLDRLLEE